MKSRRLEEAFARHMGGARQEQDGSSSARLRTLRRLAIAVVLFWAAVVIAVLIWLV